MNTDTIKGFDDYVGELATKRAVIQEIVRQNFERFGFNPTETPIIESEEFVRGENPNDEAVSDIFKLKDKGNRKLALRYELTFPLKRIAKNKKLPFKRYQIGPVFRDEPIKGNRGRQFISCDVDIVGSTVKDDAEILSLVNNILKSLKIEGVIFVNNRKLLNEILNTEKIDKKYFEEVIREIDKLDKLSSKEVYDNLLSLPGIGSFLAYQIFVDFSYLSEFPFSENEFVVAGPGCKKGLNLLFDDFGGLRYEEALFWIRDNQNRLFQQFGYNSYNLFSDLPEEERYLNLMSLENCMCEISKYIRAINGEGRPRIRYKLK